MGPYIEIWCDWCICTSIYNTVLLVSTLKPQIVWGYSAQRGNNSDSKSQAQILYTRKIHRVWTHSTSITACCVYDMFSIELLDSIVYFYSDYMTMELTRIVWSLEETQCKNQNDHAVFKIINLSFFWHWVPIHYNCALQTWLLHEAFQLCIRPKWNQQNQIKHFFSQSKFEPQNFCITASHQGYYRLTLLPLLLSECK